MGEKIKMTISELIINPLLIYLGQRKKHFQIYFYYRISI